jgi:DNA-binding XRE family transcriptional regulator
MRAGMTQVDLAVYARLTRTTISRLEKGEPNAYPSTVKKLARTLKVKPHELWEDASSGETNGA